MAKRNRDNDAADVRDLEDSLSDYEDGVVDALEHLRSGRIERAVRVLEKLEPEDEDNGEG
jgi:hypothetical protein